MEVKRPNNDWQLQDWQDNIHSEYPNPKGIGISTNYGIEGKD
jgi:hypothetical protein